MMNNPIWYLLLATSSTHFDPVSFVGDAMLEPTEAGHGVADTEAITVYAHCPAT